MHTMTAPAHAGLRIARPNRLSWRTIVTAFRVMRERAALARMDDHELADVGLTREDVLREAARPFWQ